jgi:chromosomal replication initiator protein
MESVGEKLQQELRHALAERVGLDRFGLWFGDDVRLGIDGEALSVSVPNAFFRDWIQAHYTSNLIEAAAAVLGRPVSIQIAIEAEAEPKPSDVIEITPGAGRKTGLVVPIPVKPAPAFTPSSPQDNYPHNQARVLRSLNDFVVGSGSRLAHAAAFEIAQTLGVSFNPLLIHGGVGLGKTHLLEGVGSGIRARHPGVKVVQLTAEVFTNTFLDAMRAGALASFRAKYRNAGALIVDDVHFLASTRATQSEFLHTFNALLSAGAPIILSADKHPRLITKLTDELVTRFLGGMVVRLEPPDLDTRRVLLKTKSLAKGIELPEPIIDYIAEHLRASVRELEGALQTLAAHARLNDKRLDLALAKVALRDTIRHTAQAIAIKDIEQAVCGLFAVDPEALRSEGRARTLAHPRMLAMYLARKYTGASYSEIGRYLGGRNHSTVISAEKKVLAWIQEEKRHGLLGGFESVSDVLAVLEHKIGR